MSKPTLNEMIEGLNAIIYSNNEYFLNVTITEVTKVNIAHPVYTQHGNVSRRFKDIRQTTRTREVTKNYPVGEGVARAIGRQMRMDGRIGNRVDFGTEIVQYILSPEVAADGFIIPDYQEEIARDMEHGRMWG